MNYKFLCPTHREELKSKPDRALVSWANTNETGLNLADHGKHTDALPHLACAFEIADIILTQAQIDQVTIEQDQATAIFTKSTLSLALSLNVLGLQEQKESILMLAIDRLNKQPCDDEFKSDQMALLTHSLSTRYILH